MPRAADDPLSSALPCAQRFATSPAIFARWLPRAADRCSIWAPAAVPPALIVAGGALRTIGERRGAGGVAERLRPTSPCARISICATIDVLTRNGVEVIVPAAQGCCGGLAWHTGELQAARRCARRTRASSPKTSTRS